MPKDKQKISFENDLEIDDCANYLQSIVQGLKSRSLILSQDDKIMELQPASVICTEIKAKQRTGRGSLVIELSWDTEREEALEFASKIMKAQQDTSSGQAAAANTSDED